MQLRAERGQQAACSRRTEAGGEHHHHRQQAVAGTGELAVEVAQGDGVHHGELQRIDRAEEGQLQQAHAQVLARRHQDEAGHRQADQHGVGHQYAAIAVAFDQLHRQLLRHHARGRHRHHHQAGVHRPEAKADLQQQRNQHRHGTAADAREQVAENADAIAGHAEQRQRKQRCR
ncbi:hypothetical protein D3C73_1258900 [compost metagenome]